MPKLNLLLYSFYVRTESDVTLLVITMPNGRPAELAFDSGGRLWLGEHDYLTLDTIFNGKPLRDYTEPN